MRTALSLLVAVAVLFAFAVGVQAAEETLKGNITCAKCELQKEDECTTVIVVKKGEEEVVYYFDKAAGKKYHKDICRKGKEGTVTGTVEEKDGKKVVTVTKLEYKK